MMTLNEAGDYLNSLNKFGSVLGLDNIRALLYELKNPQDKLKIIHVTGTNGKGSTCACLSSILTEAGYRVGMYNSPAVICEYDQYKINNKTVSAEMFSDAVFTVKNAIDTLNKKGIHITRFEAETASAFVLFLKENTDIAIIETGLGGRDDATCVIKDAIMYVITSISEDHIPVLGDDVLQIAGNKSHIIKSSAPTVLYDSGAEITEIIKKRCEKYNSPLYISGLHNSAQLSVQQPTQHPQSYKLLNASLAETAANVLTELGYKITPDNILCGINKAYIPFRFEKLSVRPVIIADGAHNPDGAKMLIEALRSEYGGSNYIFVIGIFKDKDYDGICRAAGGIAQKVYAVSNDMSERALDEKILAKCLKKYNDNVLVCGTIEEAVYNAICDADKSDNTIVVLFGSLSWLNRAKTYIDKLRA